MITAGCAKVSNTPPEDANNQFKAFASLSPYEFQKKSQENGVIVIDIRTPQEIARGKAIDAALEMDFYAPDFQRRLQALDKNSPYLIYCRSGNRTSAALSMMKKMGFTNVHDLKGGMSAWNRKGCQTLCAR